MTPSTRSFRSYAVVPGALSRTDVTRTIALLQEVVRRPHAYPEEAILLGLCLFIALTLVVVITLIVMTPSERRKRARRSAADEPASIRDELKTTRRSPVSRALTMLTGPILLGMFLLMAFCVLYVASSSDQYCLESCHRTDHRSEAALASSHARCVQCHEEPLVSGVLDNTLSRARMGVGALLDMPVDHAVSVPSVRCLRCHRATIKGGVIVSDTGIAMSHAEPLAAGIPCMECHHAIGHAAETAGMSHCISCHDGTSASSECETCHRRDPSASAFREMEDGGIQSARGAYPVVHAARRDCGLCHDQSALCDPCHGLRLPHSAEFKRRGHARAAEARPGRTRCLQCHTRTECSSCHARRD